MVGDGRIYAAQHAARKSTQKPYKSTANEFAKREAMGAEDQASKEIEEAKRKAIREETERKAKAAEELKIQQKAAADTRAALGSLVPKLANQPLLLRDIIKLASDGKFLDAIVTGAEFVIKDTGKTDIYKIYSALNKAKVELVSEQVIPYLLNNGLLEALSQVSKEQAKAIFAEVLELPFIKDKGFIKEDRDNLSAAFDKTMDIVGVFKEDQQTLAQLGSIVAEIGFPREVDPNESQKDKEIRVALANNHIYIALKTVLPTLATQPSMISELVTQSAKVIDSFTPQNIRDLKERQELIKDIDAALKQGVKLEFYRKQKANRQKQEVLSQEIRKCSQDDPEIKTKKEQFASLQKEQEKLKGLIESNQLSPEATEKLKDRKKVLEGLAAPLDGPRLYISETLGLKPGELTTLARFVEQPIKDLLAESPAERKRKLAEELVGIINLPEDQKAAKFTELVPRIQDLLAENPAEDKTKFSEELGGIIILPENQRAARFTELVPRIQALLAENPAEDKTKLAEELVGIINLPENQRAARFTELTPRIIENQSAAIQTALEDNEFKGVIRGNQPLKAQIAAQGFEGQEQKVIDLALDSVYPSLIKPALQDRSLITLLDKTLNPEASTADQVNAAIDFASTHRAGVGSVIDAVTKTYEEETKEGGKTIKVTKFENIGLVQAALARAGVAEGEDLTKLAPQVSEVIRDNKEALLDLTEAAAAMDPTVRKLILEEVLPAKAPEKVKREELIKVYRNLTGKSEDDEIPDDFTTEMLEITIRGILEAQNKKDDSIESSLTGSISSKGDRGIAQTDSSRSVSVDSQVADREHHSDATALRKQETSVDVVNPLHEAAKESSSTKKEASSEKAALPKEPLLASVLEEYHSHIPKLLRSATSLVEALSSEKQKGATKNLVEGVSELLKAKRERELLEASPNIDQKRKKEIEDREKGLMVSIVMQGLQTARNPEVLKETKQAISENREFLVNVVDKQLEQLRASKDNWFLNRINGQFIVKAIEHANNPKSLEAIEKFATKPSISGAMYLAWKTNNIKIAIGAVAGYFKQQEEEKQKEIAEKTLEEKKSLERHTGSSRVSCARNLSVISRRSISRSV